MGDYTSGTSYGVPNMVWLAAAVLIIIFAIITYRRSMCHHEGLEVIHHHRRKRMIPRQTPSSASSVSDLTVLYGDKNYYVTWIGTQSLTYTYTLRDPATGTILGSGTTTAPMTEFTSGSIIPPSQYISSVLTNASVTVASSPQDTTTQTVSVVQNACGQICSSPYLSGCACTWCWCDLQYPAGSYENNNCTQNC